MSGGTTEPDLLHLLGREAVLFSGHMNKERRGELVLLRLRQLARLRHGLFEQLRHLSYPSLRAHRMN
jgi:hypothetical protein